MADESALDASRLLDAVAQAVIATDADGRIVVWNHAAEELYGWSAAEVLGRPVLEVTPAGPTGAEAEAVMRLLQRGEPWSGEMELRRRHGETFLASVTDSPVLDDAGRLVGVIGVSEDVTSRRWAEAELGRSAQRLRMALRAGRLGIWEWDRATGVVVWDAGVERMFGIPPDTFGGSFEEYLDRLHPDDRPAIVSAIERAAAGGGDLHIEHRVIHADGSVRWLEGRGTTTEVGGGASGLIGVTADVTERHEAEVERQRLLEAEASARADAEEVQARLRFHTALLEAQNEAGIEAQLLVDPDGRVRSYNQRFTQLWNFDPELVATATDADLVEAAAAKVAEPDAFRGGVESTYADPSGPTRTEVTLLDGRVLDRHGAPVRGPDGEYFGWLWQFRDVTTERAQQRDIVAAGERFASLALVLQQSLLPPSLPLVPGVELAARYHPGLEGLEVGGDFYDVFAVDAGWLLVIGDVCGKGADAAAVTALIRYTVRAAAVRAADPAEILLELNAAMRAQRVDDERFATVACIRLDPRPEGVTVTVACAGHPPALLVEEDGTVSRVGRPGTLVGLFDAIEVASTTMALPAGSVLLAVTDGVLEARDRAGRQFDETGLVPALAAQAGRPVEEVVDAIEAAALAHQGGRARDDIAIVGVRAVPA